MLEKAKVPINGAFAIMEKNRCADKWYFHVCTLALTAH